MGFFRVQPGYWKSHASLVQNSYTPSRVQALLNQNRIKTGEEIPTIVGHISYVSEPKDGKFGKYQVVRIADPRKPEVESVLFVNLKDDASDTLSIDDKGKLVLFSAANGKGRTVRLRVQSADRSKGNAWPAINVPKSSNILVELNKGDADWLFSGSSQAQPSAQAKPSVASQAGTRHYDIAKSMRGMSRLFYLAAESMRRTLNLPEDYPVSQIMQEYGEYVRMIVLSVIRFDTGPVDLADEAVKIYDRITSTRPDNRGASGSDSSSLAGDSAPEPEPEPEPAPEDFVDPSEMAAGQEEQDEVPF